jgi:hypothetical protein
LQKEEESIYVTQLACRKRRSPYTAVRAAGIEGTADLAIHQKQPFVSGKFRKTTREIER